MTFTLYVVISLKEKAAGGNTVSILSQLSKLNFQPSFANGNIQDPSEQNVRHTKYVYRQGVEEDTENNKRVLE